MTLSYLILIENEDQRDAIFRFEKLEDLQTWMLVKDEPGESPGKHNAQYLGTVFRPKDLTPDLLSSLHGFAQLFTELDNTLVTTRDTQRRRRTRYNNRPNRR